MISAVALELRDNLDTEALQELQEFLAESMDRHAACAARDDRARAVIARERSDRSNPFKKVDSSFKAMDRHASTTALARDDRESNNSKPTTQAEGLKNQKRKKARLKQLAGF